MAVTIPDEFTNKGPQPFQPPFTFSAQEDLRRGSIVSLGTNERSVKMCDLGEHAIGWAQAAASSGEQVDISLFAPVWRVDIDSGSGTIVYGDIVEVADDGRVKKSDGTSPNNIVGFAIRGGAANGQALIIVSATTAGSIT